VVIALVVTPEGFPLAYEVMAGNTSDKTTLRGFLEKIEKSISTSLRLNIHEMTRWPVLRRLMRIRHRLCAFHEHSSNKCA
jgi:hypothetical protein